jgi:hypothetical protein
LRLAAPKSRPGWSLRGAADGGEGKAGRPGFSQAPGVPPCAAGDKKARLVRERGDACTAVSRAEVSLPREGVRVSMSVGTSVRVRVRVSCWFDRY